MNLTTRRSGQEVFLNVECIKGYAFKLANAGEKSAHFCLHLAANGSPFMLWRDVR